MNDGPPTFCVGGFFVSVWLEVGERVDGFVAFSHFEVEVRTGGDAEISDGCDGIASFHFGPFGD